jgi:hypothetical protein
VVFAELISSTLDPEDAGDIFLRNVGLHGIISQKMILFKVMLVTFFTSQGIIHKEFVPPGHTVDKEYVEVLSCLVQRIHQIRPQFQERGGWFLWHDNATPHTAVSVKQFLAKQGVPELNPPHILVIYSHQTFSCSPKSKPRLNRKYLMTQRTLKGM